MYECRVDYVRAAHGEQDCRVDITIETFVDGHSSGARLSTTIFERLQESRTSQPYDVKLDNPLSAQQ